MHVAAIIAAGGRGLRLGTPVPKQFIEICGRSMLDRSLDAFETSERVSELIVVLPPEMIENPPASLDVVRKPLRLAAGGATRQESVANGFALVSDLADVIVVHDAARPFVTPALISRTIDAAIETGAAIAALAVKDTVKQSIETGGVRLVGATLARETIHLAQTPQAFRREVLIDAIALGRSGAVATDEAALAERAGHAVRLVEGDTRNIKITTQEDLLLARAMSAGGIDPDMRVGTGYDLHRLVDGRPLILGGVTIPFERGLAGHSDADALCHAITDAILGAAAAGDIGRHFPDTDCTWKDASSLDMLQRAAAIVHEAGFVIVNVDAVVVAQQPKLAPHVSAMAARLAETLGIERARVSVKGKTNEGVGETGRSEAIAVHAVALLKRN